MKKILTAALSLLGVLTLAGTLVACGGDKTSSTEPSSSAPASSVAAPSSSTAVSNVHRDVDVEDTTLQDIVGTGKVYLTTFGQADWSYAKSIVNGATMGNVGATENNLLTAADVENGSTVVAVVGYTSKGLAATITQASELARANAMSKKAEDGEINLVVLHLGGKARRGDSSDPMISAAISHAKVVFIYDDETDNGGNYDGQFETWVGTTVQLYMWSDEIEMVDSVKYVLGA